MDGLGNRWGRVGGERQQVTQLRGKPEDGGVTGVTATAEFGMAAVARKVRIRHFGMADDDEKGCGRMLVIRQTAYMLSDETGSFYICKNENENGKIWA